MKAPPPLVLFHSLEKYLQALDAVTEDEYRRDISTLFAKGLPPVVSIRALAALFGFRSQFIGTMVKRPEYYYRTFTIPKGKKRRKIEAPKVALKVIQKWVGHHLARAVSLPENVVGFVPERSTMDGAIKHCQMSWILSTDIENFFQTTSSDLVIKALEELGYQRHGAELIASLTTLNGYLAQGSPASPVLSNLAFRKFDDLLISLASKFRINYTRYADDLVFSGKENVPENLLENVQAIVESGKWKLSKEKTELIYAPKRLKVYGLLVNGSKPRLTKGYRKRIRAIRHLMDTEKIPAEKIVEALGHLSYANSVEKFVPI